MRRWITKVAGAASCALAFAATGAAPAQADYLYVTGSNSILRAPLDAASAPRVLVANTGLPRAVAVTADHVWWTNGTDGAIGRANLDGTGVDRTFIPGVSPEDPGTGRTNLRGIAVIGDHVFWTDYGYDPELGENWARIGRAALDGTDVRLEFLDPVTLPVALAADQDHLFWMAYEGIGRARVDGTDVQPTFITGSLPSARAVAVDGAHVYWTNTTNSWNSPTIGRANLDGSGVDQAFITGTRFPAGLAVTASHVYWGNLEGTTSGIGRANLDGSGANQAYVSGVRAEALAVGPGAVRTIATTVSCAPASVPRSTPTTCSVTATDPAANAPSPAGGARLTSSGTGTLFNGGFCQLVATGPASSGCDVTWTPSASSTRTDVISATTLPSSAGLAGSTAETTVEVTVPDTRPPTSTITLSAPDGLGGAYRAGAHVTVTAVDPDGGTVAATRCVVDPPAAPVSFDDLPAGCPFTGSGSGVTAEGDHAVYVASVDAAGNREAPTSRTFRVDRTAPATTITSGPSGQYTPGPLDLRGAAAPVTDDTTPTFGIASSEGPSTFECRVDAETFVLCTSPHTTRALAPGRHTFSARAIDAAGNVDDTPATLAFTVAPRCGVLGVTIPLAQPLALCV